MSQTTIDVKLFVDEEKRRVLFAECDEDFVDVLCSFLTLPLGTVARVLGKQSRLGCLDDLYKSVEGLSSDLFETKACKRMLLAPLNSAFDHCSRLKARVDDRNNPRSMYVCKDESCDKEYFGCARFSSIPDAICTCGKVMQYVGDRPEQDKVDLHSGVSEPGVFVNGGLKFIVSDDLRITPASTYVMMSLLEELGLGVRDAADLKQRTIKFTSEKIHNLLKTSLTSKKLLTELCFDVPSAHDDAYQYVLPRNFIPKQEIDAAPTQVGVKINVIQTKNNSSLLYAEVGHDFVDLLFGILSIPLGSIKKSYGTCAPNGCIDNLYSSIDGSAKGCIRQECKNLLLSPKLAPFFGCGATKLLQVEELALHNQAFDACLKCLKFRSLLAIPLCHTHCTASVKSTSLLGWDPRSLTSGSNNRQAYVKNGHRTFMLTDNLNVLPWCSASALQAVVEANIQSTDIMKKEYFLTDSQVKELVKAALVTRKALSAVLMAPKNNKLKNYSHLLY